MKQFNLATAYENTGQNAKAIALYEAVVIDGQFTGSNILPGAGTVRDPKTTADPSAEATRPPDQQEVNHFDSQKIVWTQRYQFVGHTDAYRYTLNRATASLDVSRPFPDTSSEAKVVAEGARPVHIVTEALDRARRQVFAAAKFPPKWGIGMLRVRSRRLAQYSGRAGARSGG